jgi:hypothetical protein
MIIGGGALAYGNTISVTAGTPYTVVVGAAGVGKASETAGNGASGAVRIIWPGNTRTFPSSAT